MIVTKIPILGTSPFGASYSTNNHDFSTEDFFNTSTLLTSFIKIWLKSPEKIKDYSHSQIRYIMGKMFDIT